MLKNEHFFFLYSFFKKIFPRNIKNTFFTILTGTNIKNFLSLIFTQIYLLFFYNKLTFLNYFHSK